MTATPAAIYALVSHVGWGTGDVFGVFASRKMGTYSVTFWGLVLSVGISTLYAPFALHELRALTPSLLAVNVALGVVLLVGLVAFNEGLRTANPVAVGSIAAAFPAVIVVLSLFFLRERPTIVQLSLVMLILLGLFLTVFDMSVLRADRALLLPVVAMLAWGIYYTFVKSLVASIGWFWPNYFSMWLFPVLFVVSRKFDPLSTQRTTFRDGLPYLIPGVILVRTAEFSYNIGVSRGLSAIVGPIAGSYATLFVVLSWIVFREPLRRPQIVGVLLSLGGVVGLLAL